MNKRSFSYTKALCRSSFKAHLLSYFLYSIIFLFVDLFLISGLLIAQMSKPTYKDGTDSEYSEKSRLVFSGTPEDLPSTNVKYVSLGATNEDRQAFRGTIIKKTDTITYNYNYSLESLDLIKDEKIYGRFPTSPSEAIVTVSSSLPLYEQKGLMGSYPFLNTIGLGETINIVGVLPIDNERADYLFVNPSHIKTASSLVTLRKDIVLGFKTNNVNLKTSDPVVLNPTNDKIILNKTGLRKLCDFGGYSICSFISQEEYADDFIKTINAEGLNIYFGKNEPLPKYEIIYDARYDSLVSGIFLPSNEFLINLISDNNKITVLAKSPNGAEEIRHFFDKKNITYQSSQSYELFDANEDLKDLYKIYLPLNPSIGYLISSILVIVLSIVVLFIHNHIRIDDKYLLKMRLSKTTLNKHHLLLQLPIYIGFLILLNGITLILNYGFSFLNRVVYFTPISYIFINLIFFSFCLVDLIQSLNYGSLRKKIKIED